MRARTTWRWFALILVVALVAAACGDDDAVTTTTAPPATTTTAAAPTTTIDPGVDLTGVHCVGCDPRATSVLADLESIESEDGKTIIITYPEDYADPEWFARYGVTYPAHIAEAQGFDWKNDPFAMGESSVFFNETVPFWSGGPYIITSATLGERVIMEPNPAWWGAIQPTVDLLVKEMVASPDAWLAAMRNQELDGASPAAFPVDLLGQLAQEPGVHFATGSGGAVWDHIDMNMDNPFLADKVLRQAIFIALDREDAITRIFGDLNPQRRNNHIFPQGSPYYVDYVEGTGYGSGDAAAALALLTDAGYTLDGDQLITPDGDPVAPLRWSYLAANENRRIFAELAQSYLADIGVPVALEATDALGATLGAQDYDVVHFGWSGSPLFTNAPNQFWHSTSGSNFGKFVNAEVDALVESVLQQVDIAVSADLANQAVQIVLDEAYVFPLWDTTNLTFVTDQIANFRDNHFSSLRSFYNMEEWGVAAAGPTPGLDECGTDPLNCNSAERAQGGTVTVLINQAWDSWNHHRPEGGSVYLFQALAGIEPRFGYFAPDGNWVWDFNYLAEAPEVLSENPLTLQFVISDDAVWDDGTPIGYDDMLWWWYHNSGRGLPEDDDE